MNERILELAEQATRKYDRLGCVIPPPNSIGACKMNERILELARQVWPDTNISHVNHMKFAELIVRKCCDVLYDNEMGGYRVDHVLKEYFGIEE